MNNLSRKEQNLHGPAIPLLNNGNWNPDLHPRDSNGEFIYTDGGLHGKSPSRTPSAKGPSALKNALSSLAIDRSYKDKNDGKANPHGIYITHYGPSKKVGGWEDKGDSNTDRGIGNNNNRLNNLSLAVSSDIVKAAQLKLGGPVYVNGQYIGNYDDTPGEAGRIDIYDHDNAVGKNWGGMVWGGVVTNHP